MYSESDLALCSGTVIQYALPEMVEAAVAAGFSALTLWPQDYQRARSAGWSDAELRRLLADNGLVALDLDPLLTWLPGEAELAQSLAKVEVASEDDFYRIADVFGAQTLNAVQGFGSAVDVSQAADACGALCDRAARHGLTVTLEFVPWSGIANASRALAIAEKSGRANATVMLDTWHWFRSGADFSHLAALPGARIGGVQINDAPSTGPGDPVEAMQGRLWPGEGAIPLARVLRALWDSGARVRIGVEVFSSALASLSPAEIGRRAGATGRAALAAARALPSVN
jgi:sugar phosphate isomerase/epimerase